MNYPQQTINWKGKKFTIIWVKTDSLEGISPIKQVYGICFNDKGEILICRKARGGWHIPGGKPEGNETIEETLGREMIEEVDIKVKNIKILGYQKVVPVENPNKIIYQVRCICEVDEILTQTPDPDNGEIWKRKFVPTNEVTNYVKWGEIGEAMFRYAIELWKR